MMYLPYDLTSSFPCSYGVMMIFTIHSVFPPSNRKIWETTLILLLVSCWQCCVVGFVSSSGVGRWPQRNPSNLEVTNAKADQKLYIRNTVINRSLDKSILIVENDNDLRKAIGKFLAKGGYHVTGVADARSAILVCRGIVRPVNSSRTRFKLDPNFTKQHLVGDQSINSTKNSTLSIVPDCLVLDIQLGGAVDGLGLLNIIRSDPVLASLPVVLLTAKGKVEDRIIGYGSDADAYLPKPFEPEELLSIIDGLLLRENVTSSTEQYGNKKSNIVYRDLKRELTEIKNLLNLNAPSNGMSMTTDISLQRDVLEIKNKLKDLVVDQTPQYAKPMKYNYDSISILSPGKLIIA